MRNLSSEPVTAKVYIASLNPHSPSFQAPTTFSSLPTLSSTLLHCAFSPLPNKPSMPSKRFQNLVRVYRRSFRHLVQGPWGGYRGVGKAGWRGSCRGPLDRSEAFKRAFCRGIADRYWSRQHRPLWGRFGRRIVPICWVCCWGHNARQEKRTCPIKDKSLILHGGRPGDRTWDLWFRRPK